MALAPALAAARSSPPWLASAACKIIMSTMLTPEPAAVEAAAAPEAWVAGGERRCASSRAGCGAPSAPDPSVDKHLFELAAFVSAAGCCYRPAPDPCCYRHAAACCYRPAAPAATDPPPPAATEPPPPAATDPPPPAAADPPRRAARYAVQDVFSQRRIFNNIRLKPIDRHGVAKEGSTLQLGGPLSSILYTKVN
jgi:hypothetical protein